MDHVQRTLVAIACLAGFGATPAGAVTIADPENIYGSPTCPAT